jgi:hypothetical protein
VSTEAVFSADLVNALVREKKRHDLHGANGSSPNLAG